MGIQIYCDRCGYHEQKITYKTLADREGPYNVYKTFEDIGIPPVFEELNGKIFCGPCAARVKKEMRESDEKNN
jgi:uncharacterized Zn finger protein (UPF0148 family)